MPDRVIRNTISWKHRDTGDESTVTYYQATADVYADLAQESAATQLTPEDLDAIEAYRRACEDGAAQITNKSVEVVQ